MRSQHTDTRIKLFGDGDCGVLEFFEKGRRNSEEINAGKSLDLASLYIISLTYAKNAVNRSSYIAERCTHDDRLVTVLFIIVENRLDRLNTRVFITFIVLTSTLLVPVQDLNK